MEVGDKDEEISFLKAKEEEEEKSNVVKTPETSLWFRGLVLFGLVCQTVCTIVFMQYSQSTLVTTESGIRYKPSTAVLFAELTKMFIGLFVTLLYGDVSECFDSLWKMSVPACLYVIQNNLLFVALGNLDSCIFQVVYQIKVLTTACFTVLLLGRSLSRREWTAIFFLLLGAVCANIRTDDNSETSDQLIDRNTYLGLTSVFCCTLTSGFAGVWSEKVLKGGKIDLWVRNFQLGFFSVLGSLLIIWQRDSDFIKVNGFLGGYTWHTHVVILLNALGGYLIAMTIKYMSNIAKAFANAFSIIVGTLAAVVLFNFRVNFYFIFAMLFVCVGIYLNTDSKVRAMIKRYFNFALRRRRTHFLSKEAKSKDIELGKTKIGK